MPRRPLLRAGSFNHAFGFGIYGGGPTTWVDADGYLPAQITSFTRQGAAVAITEFADRVVLGGNAYVAVYCPRGGEEPVEQCGGCRSLPVAGSRAAR